MLRKSENKNEKTSRIKSVAQNVSKSCSSLADNRKGIGVSQLKNKMGLPDKLKSGIENLSGINMSDTKVHYNSDKPTQLNAHAYAQGTDIHIASGQEKHLPHEAWHVVQQKQGRVKPTMQMKGKVNVNDDAGLEREADVMGAKAPGYFQLQQNKSILSDGSLVNKDTVQLVKRVKTKGGNTGTDYDSKKFNDQFHIEKQKFEDLPGNVAERDDYSWHHIVPQAHIGIAQAENQKMIRLGPASKYRLDDPDDNFTDPNYSRDGSLTPVSSSIDGLFDDSTSLDKGELTKRLQAIFDDPEHADKEKTKSYSDPEQWYMDYMTLSNHQDIKLSAMEKEELKKLMVIATHHDKAEHEMVKSNVVPWASLSKKMISPELFAKIHKIMVHEKRILFRGFEETDDISKQIFRIKAPLAGTLMEGFNNQVNSDAQIKELIQEKGAFLIFSRRINRLINDLVHATQSMIKSQGLNQNTNPRADRFGSLKFEYFQGTGEVKLKGNEHTRALQKGSRWQGKKIAYEFNDPKEIDDDYILGNERLIQMSEHEKEVAMVLNDSEIEQMVLELVKEYSVRDALPGMTKGKGAQSKQYLASDEEVKLLTLFNKQISAKKAPKGGKGPIKEKRDSLVDDINSRKIDEVRDTAKLSAIRTLQEQHVKPAEEEKKRRVIDKFRRQQDDAIAKVNDLSHELQRFMGGGFGESQNEVLSMTNLEFLMKFLDESKNLMITVPKKHILDLPMKKPAKPEDLDKSVAIYVEQVQIYLRAHIHDIYKLIHVQLIKGEAELRKKSDQVDSNLPAEKMEQKGVLVKLPEKPVKKPSEDLGAIEQKKGVHEEKGVEASLPPNVLHGGRLLVDQDGGILEHADEIFRQAYRKDVANSNAYLNEGEGDVVARQLGIRVAVFRGGIPLGYEVVDNSGGGNCLIHSLTQAKHAIDAGDNSTNESHQARPEDILAHRQHIAQGLQDDDVTAAAAVAVAGQIHGEPEPGLGENMRHLTRMAHLHQIIAQTKVGDKEEQPKPAEKKESPPVEHEVEQEDKPLTHIGAGKSSDDVAILHTGGVHWVMIRKRK